MPTITRPVTQTVIQTTGWGVPVTDQINQNTTDLATIRANHIVAFRHATVSQSGMANGTPANITGMSVTFTAIATHNYRVTFQAAMTGTAAGQWLQALANDSGGITASRYFAACACSALPGFGHGLSGTYIVGPNAGVAFPSGSVTVNLVGNGQGAGTTWGVGGWCLLAVEDLGPF